MKERELNTAIKFNIVEECKKLETELLQIDRVAEVEFDLDGFYDNMNQVIVLTKYDVPVGMENYFQKRREIIMNVIETARKNF